MINERKLNKESRIYVPLAFLLIMYGISFFISTSVKARDVLDLTDPAFNGGVTIPLPPAGLGSNDTVFQFQSNGVTFTFESLSGRPLAGGCGILSFGFATQGVLISIDPPVSAIGFLGQELDGRPDGTFMGTLGDEYVMSSAYTVLQAVLPPLAISSGARIA